MAAAGGAARGARRRARLLLHGAAGSVGGARDVLLGDADDAAANAVPLGASSRCVLLRSTDTRVCVSALGFAAQLCETAVVAAAAAASSWASAGFRVRRAMV